MFPVIDYDSRGNPAVIGRTNTPVQALAIINQARRSARMRPVDTAILTRCWDIDSKSLRPAYLGA
jgi:hypothetical protein